MIGLRTLVLNNNYIPISMYPLHHIPAEDAMTRVYNETCYVVLEYDRPILTQQTGLKWPSVIARIATDYVSTAVKLRPESLYYRDHGKCQYCHEPVTVNAMTCDHVVPQSLGGPFTWENIVTACSRCNGAKGNHRPEGRWKLPYKPKKPTYHQLLKNRRQFPITVGDINWMQFLGDWDGQVNINAAGA